MARFGGDEFIIMIKQMEDVSCIELIAEKLLSSFYQPFTLNDQDCFMTTSIGIAMYPMDGRTADQLIKNADIAMVIVYFMLFGKKKSSTRFIPTMEVL